MQETGFLVHLTFIINLLLHCFSNRTCRNDIFLRHPHDTLKQGLQYCLHFLQETISRNAANLVWMCHEDFSRDSCCEYFSDETRRLKTIGAS